MDSWIECAWFGCRKRFEPARRSNQFRNPDNDPHEGALYCSRACQQKAYRHRRRGSAIVTREGAATVTDASGDIGVQATVTPSKIAQSFQRADSAKNGHPRPIFALHRGRSKRVLVRVVPDGALHRILWPDAGPSDLCNLSRAKAAALEWAERKEAKLPATVRLPLKWVRHRAGGGDR
jgi:hypothetical protein